MMKSVRGVRKMSVRLLNTFGLIIASLAWAALPASANLQATIDLSSQRMTVTVDGWQYASWPVSTARRGYHTPVGSFRPQVLRRMHYSSKYENSPMPHSVFFKGGYAIHGTGYLKSLGRPASHGCIRLHPRNAATLYRLVLSHGMGATRIVIRR
jgi:lipoprotein-anchoring transpeptidase ErfK/SrfK